MSVDKIMAKTHNLVKLAEHTRLNLTGEHKIFLDEVNDFNLEARCPQFKNEFYKKCTRQFAEHYYRKTEEMKKWLKSRIK